MLPFCKKNVNISKMLVGLGHFSHLCPSELVSAFFKCRNGHTLFIMSDIFMRTNPAILFVLLLFSFSHARAQMSEPVKWSYSAERIAVDEYKVVFSAQIEAGWFVYSQFLTESTGPVKTSFAYEPKPGIELQGITEEFGPKEEGYDLTFGMHIVKYMGLTQFTQKVKVKPGESPLLNAQVTYMACNEHTCLPPRDVPFSVPLNR